MKRLILSVVFAVILLTNIQTIRAQIAPIKQWDRCFGGSSIDGIKSIAQTPDGGYILGGISESGISFEKSEASKGGRDYWVVKIDALGNKQWDKTVGGSGKEDLTSLVPTADGGYLLGGYSLSSISGDKTEPSRSIGKEDYWIVKLNAAGNKVWDKTFGGLNTDKLYSLAQTSDGGYILGGTSDSFMSGDKSQNAKGSIDYWIIRLDASGNKVWDKTFGGSIYDAFLSLDLTSDGGYILGGYSDSPVSGDKTQASKGHYDYWIVKLDASGNKLWDKTIGGSWADLLNQIHQTSDGGYILGGVSGSNISGDKTQVNQGDWDYWIVKLNPSGQKVWDKNFGGSGYDWLSNLQQTSDGGYILNGYSDSPNSNDKSQGKIGLMDYWIVRVNMNGNKLWDKTIGGNWYNYSISSAITTDNGYILGGESNSNIYADKTQVSRGLTDFWVVKLGPDLLGVDEVQDSEFSLYPNPSSGRVSLQLGNIKPSQVTVYNSLAQRVFIKDVVKTPNEEHIQIDLSKEAKGIYTIQVLSDNQVTTKKVVLQ